MARISIKQLEAFVAVADQSSFRRAAASLNTTQPNISARIAALEDLIGHRLMERDAGSVRLTPAGRLLVERARAALAAVDEFMDCAGAAGLFEGTLRLGVAEMIVHSWLGTFLAALRRRFPSLTVDLTVDLSANLSDALHGNAIDLALQSGPFNRQTTGAIDLGSYPMVWVAAPELGVGEDDLTLDGLLEFPILTHARQTQPFRQLEQHVAGRPGARLMPSTNSSACMRMTTEGLGIACLLRAMVEEEIGRGRLRVVRYHWLPDDLAFSARFHAQKASHVIVEAAALAADVSHRFVAGSPANAAAPHADAAGRARRGTKPHV